MIRASIGPPGMATMVLPEACIGAVGRISAAFRIESLAPQIKACREALQDRGIVDVAVLGRFKAGKSSFLNSLLGRNLMPVAVLPATAVVTRLSPGPKDRAVVHRMDGACQEIPLEQLPEFVTEQRNPENEKGVAQVEVELASLAPLGGIRFVDTPGLGSVYAHNTRISKEWLPQVGAAMVVIAADQPLSEQDLDLLKELERHTPQVAILLTKADLVAEHQRAEILSFLRRQTAKNLGKELRIFPYSIQPGFEALREDLRRYLVEQIAARHVQEFDEILGYKVRSLIAGCKQYVLVAEHAAIVAETARETLAKLLEQERYDLGSVQNEIWLLAADLKSRLRGAAAKEALAFHSDLLGRLLEDLNKQPSLRRGNLRRMTEAYEAWVETALKRELDPVLRETGERLGKFLDEAEGSFTRVVRGFQDRLSRAIEEALHTSFSGAVFQAAVAPPARPDVQVGRIFDMPIEMLWFLIPMWIFRPLVRRHFRRMLWWQVGKNLYRLAAQWSDAFNVSIDDVASQAQKFIENEMATVGRLVSGTDNQLAEIRAALQELDALVSSTSQPSGNGPSRPNGARPEKG